ncbi:MAG: isocitrate/isopropylmalate dehydrogenase family protein [Acidiferrobacterales bacterium]
MNVDGELHIAVLPGDGIGVEVMDACLDVLAALRKRIGSFQYITEAFPGGAAYYRDTGVALPDESTKAVEQVDAILFGAMGLPDVRMPDGTEINPQINLRKELELYAGVRPVKAMPGGPAVLADPRAKEIDLVVIREQTEGMFTDFQQSKLEDDRVAIDRCVITRPATQRVADFSFRLARSRQRQGQRGRVTCVDKANVLGSLAFFRKVFDDRCAQYPDVATDHIYVDAAALNLVRQPWVFDVLVTENLLGDILSDLAAGLVGGMGMAPSGDIGDTHAMFQPCHGSAPDIAGRDQANPTAMFLSAVMMLQWLGEQHGIDACVTAARHLRSAIEHGFASGHIRPAEFGGPDGTSAITQTVIELVRTQPVVA